MDEVAPAFRAFMDRIRSGEERAARELVGRFEGLIRREVRVRLLDRELLRVLDSMDITQSVLKSFFARAEAGQYEVDTPEQLAGLLVAMARVKLAFHRRKHHAHRRDIRLTSRTPIDEMDLAAPGPGPGQLAAEDDLKEAVLGRLGEDEREMFRLRAEGWAWAEIAGRLGGTAQARRMQLGRAVHRVSLEYQKEAADG